MEQGEQLRCGLDDLGDERGVGVGALRLERRGVRERPRVEERDPAAQHGGVVAVPGAQSPAGPGGPSFVQLDQAGQPRPVPGGAHLPLRQAQGGGRPQHVGVP